MALRLPRGLKENSQISIIRNIGYAQALLYFLFVQVRLLKQL